MGKKFKVVFLGNESAGKTSIVRRYMYGNFDESVTATIGMDFQSKTVRVEDRAVRLQLWDTAGQERFRSLIPSYIRDAAAAVVVYDITRRVSFEGTKKWIEEVRSERGEDVKVVLVGNKSDLDTEREVPTAEGEKLAEELQAASFMETSARGDVNVTQLFQQVAAAMPESEDEGADAGEKRRELRGDVKLAAPMEVSTKKKKKECGSC